METGKREKPENFKVVSSINVIEKDYQVDRPVFNNVVVDRPIFKDKEIEIPTGWNVVIDRLTTTISDSILNKVLKVIDERVSKSIEGRLKEIEAPKIIWKEELKVITKEVTVEKPVYKNVEVKNAVLVDVKVNNAVVTDVLVTNAKIKDVEVTNAIVKDVEVKNAVIMNIPVTNAILVDKEVEVIRPKYVNA